MAGPALCKAGRNEMLRPLHKYQLPIKEGSLYLLGMRCVVRFAIAAATAFLAVLMPVGSFAQQRDTPTAEIAPAFLARDLAAIGYVTGYRPPPGGGDGVSGCSATLIAPDLVLTAAHCAASHAQQPQRMHVTFGWNRNGPPLWRGTGSAVIVDANYQPGDLTLGAVAHDIAVIRLPRPVPADLITPIPLAPGFGTAPERFAIYGYARGAPTILRGYRDCRVGALPNNMIGSDCQVESGFSGGPLLRYEGNSPVVAAVLVANAPGRREGIVTFAAKPSEAFLRRLGLAQ